MLKLPPLVKAVLIKRYKRFLADVVLEGGEQITVHCPNTGAMTGCAEAGSTVWLSTSDNPKRKYVHTWELVRVADGNMACIHSAKANVLVKEAIEKGVVPELADYKRIHTEVKYGDEGSRIDLLLEKDGRGEASGKCFVEVKSVTLHLGDGLGVFPDAVSDRGRKHLRELMSMVNQGHRAVLFFCVLHTGIKRVAPADLIDELYGDTFREAVASGVEVLVYGADINPGAIVLSHRSIFLERQPAGAQ
ncbi:MAG: DNA/RNA nuclease SfsA [Oceanicoccus sp.]